MVRKCLSGMLCNGVRLATKGYLILAFLWYSQHLFCKSIYIVSFQSAFLSFPYSSSLIHVSSSAVCILDATCISSSESGTGPALKEFLIPWCLSVNLFV